MENDHAEADKTVRAKAEAEYPIAGLQWRSLHMRRSLPGHHAMNRDSPKTFPYTKRPPTEQESLAMAIQPGPFIMHEHWPEWKGHREVAMHEAMIILRHRAKFNNNEDKYIVAIAQCIRDSFDEPLDEGTSMDIARKIIALNDIVGDAA